MSVFKYSALKVENPHIQDDGPPIPQKSLYQEFVQNTSLLGIQHFLRQKSIVWLVVYLLCVAMGVAQSWNVTVTFFEKETYQTSTIASQSFMPFPSVTLCTNTVLRHGFNFSELPNFNTSVPEKLKNCFQPDVKKEWLIVKKTNKIAVMQYLRTLTIKQRMSLGIDIVNEFVKNCTFDMQPCNFGDKKEVYIFNHPYFANCLTFNPAFEESHAKQSDIQAGLDLLVQFPSGGYWLSDEAEPNGIIHIHAPGTAPLMESPIATDFMGGDLLQIEMDLSEHKVIRKESKNMLTCVESEDEVYHKRSRYFSTDSPYRYSLEACIASCQQDYAGDDCGVINPYLPVQTEEYERDKKIKYCRVKKATNMEVCNCPISCKRLEYHIIPHTDEVDTIPCEEEAEQKNGSQKQAQQECDTKWEEAEIGVKFRRNIYQKYEERLCYTLSEYLGVLGGNLSLWIGLCVISLLEVVELGFKSAAAAIRPSRKIAAGGPSCSFSAVKRQHKVSKRPFSIYRRQKSTSQSRKNKVIHVYHDEEQ